jgi:mono/diheme cytochrome c family protein
MKKVFKVVVYFIIVIVLIVCSLMTYVVTALPNVGKAPELSVEKTAERIERGRYLANNVTMCLNCHTTRDWGKFSGPVLADSLGNGGEVFDQKVGMPGIFYSKNITPGGISRYTDGELYRAITTGVTKEGKAIFPLMPYDHYGKMDPEDIYSIIAYLRTLKPINTQVPESVADFPMNIILHSIPQKAQPGKLPPQNSKDYGAYMVNAGACIECHTKENHGQVIPELAFSGGREFLMPGGFILRSPNITPDNETGIGSLTKEAFIGMFRKYSDSSYTLPAISKGSYNTIMPWSSYCHMTDADLSAIYDYLRSIPPLKNSVIRYTPASEVARK